MHRQQIARHSRIRLYFFAQSDDEIIDGAGGDPPRVSPHISEQAISRDDLSAVEHQVMQQVEFLSAYLDN